MCGKYPLLHMAALGKTRRMGCTFLLALTACLLIPAPAVVPVAYPHYSDTSSGSDSWGASRDAGRHSSLDFLTQYGLNVALGSNVCVQKNGGIVLFPAPGEDDPISPDLLSRLFTQGQYGFRFGWEFYYATNSSKWQNRWVANATGAVVRPAVAGHIHHFAEAVIALFHASLYPKALPALNELSHLLLPTVRRSNELPWNLDFLELVLRGAQEQGAAYPQVLFSDDWPQSGEDICFERIVLIGMHTSEFGLFADPYEADLFRNYSFKFYGLGAFLERGINDKLALFLMERKRTRRLVNPRDVRSALLDTGLFDLDFELPRGLGDQQADDQKISRCFDSSVPLEQQVAWMRSTDVLIGTHGSGLINAIFMRPGSVVIDLLCPNFFETTFSTAVLSAGGHYLFLTNTNQSSGVYPDPVPPSCFTRTPWEAQTLDCISIRNCDLEADVRALDGLARQAALVVRLDKRRPLRSLDPTRGEWRRGRLPNRDMETLL